MAQGILHWQSQAITIETKSLDTSGQRPADSDSLSSL